VLCIAEIDAADPIDARATVTPEIDSGQADRCYSPLQPAGYLTVKVDRHLHRAKPPRESASKIVF
jgi:hypothetical protein